MGFRNFLDYPLHPRYHHASRRTPFPRVFLWRFPAMSPSLRITRHCILLAALVCSLIPAASAQWSEKVLYSFQGGTDAGSVPVGGLVFDQQGNLYGVTENGGEVFQLVPPSENGGAWTQNVLYVFQGNTKGDGASPSGGLVMDGKGNFYGVTASGGTGDCVLLGLLLGCGTVYELSPPANPGDPWTEKVLYSFQGGNDGYVPGGSRVFDKAGNLYGATLFGGGQGTTCDILYGGDCGTVFEMSPPQIQGDPWSEKALHSFAGGSDGALPNGGLILDDEGTLYGTTYYGGSESGQCDGGVEGTGCGTVFRLIPPTKQSNTWSEKILLRFDGQDGSGPAGVIFDKSGNLYGTTQYGGTPSDNGGVFELLRPSAEVHTWKESVLYVFTDGHAIDGAYPVAGLIFDAEGNLYGTTYQGSYSSQYGTVFQLVPQAGGGWAFNLLYGFAPGSNGPAQPNANLVFDTRGNLYSTTPFGGTGQSCQGGCGTVFELWP
jgi:hypothetical protein